MSGEESSKLNFDDDPQVYYDLGVAYFEMKKWSDAIEVLRRAVRLGPGHRDAPVAASMIKRAERMLRSAGSGGGDSDPEQP
jgi:uncharacterized protein HemY